MAVFDAIEKVANVGSRTVSAFNTLILDFAFQSTDFLSPPVNVNGALGAVEVDSGVGFSKIAQRPG